MSAYPTGSTFKPITATAALESGAWSPDETYDDTGQFCVDQECRHNAGNATYGVLDLTQRAQGLLRRVLLQPRRPAQRRPGAHPTAARFSSGPDRTGSAARPGSTSAARHAGNLPTPSGACGSTRSERRCERKPQAYGRSPAESPTAAPWSVGDNINLAVGQGDVQVTPLQLAVAYSAIANGGSVVRPHLGLEIDSPQGTVLQKIAPPPSRHLSINPLYLDTIRQGLHAAAQTAGGTSDDVMGNFPQQVYGKTGTAQRNGQADQSWYACFVPDTATNKPILVVVTVEQGGFGAAAAAPAARQILSQWFYGRRGPFKAGTSKTL